MRETSGRADERNGRKRFRRTNVGAGYLPVIAAVLAVLFMPRQTAEGATEGLKLCLDTAIPSLFPMMAASVMLVESGLAARAGRFAAPLTRRLFGLPGEAGSAVVIALVGGYPAGAKAVAGLYESGAVTADEARRMAMFCFCSGPAFMLGAVGGMLGSASCGWLLLAAQAMSVVLCGVISGMLFRRAGNTARESAEKENAGKNADDTPLAEILVSSVGQASRAMLTVCAFIIIFSALRGILDGLRVGELISSALVRLGAGEETARAALPVLLEVTSGCSAAVKAGLPLTGFAAGFGGLAVHAQVYSICSELRINAGQFTLMRVINGLLCAGLTALLMKLFPSAVTVTADLHAAELSGTPVGAAALVVMCFMCVLCLPDEIVKKSCTR